jgi:hypothetical protein
MNQFIKCDESLNKHLIIVDIIYDFIFDTFIFHLEIILNLSLKLFHIIMFIFIVKYL